MESLQRYIGQIIKVVSHGTGTKTQKHAPRFTGGPKLTADQHSKINTFPEKRLPHIQDTAVLIDPLSPDLHCGGFFYMAGYDPLGSRPLGG